MLEIYHLAADVRVWLGPRTDEASRCDKFITEFSGRVYSSKPPGREPSAIVEPVAKVVLLSSGKIVSTVYVGQAVLQISDLVLPSYRDNKAKMILDPDSELSLHHDTIEKLTK